MYERLKLARVRWYLGQSLLPEHLLASEQALSAESYLRTLIGGRSEYGVARLRWNDELLVEGVLTITELTVVMRDGVLLDVPHNAVISPLTLAMTGTARVPVYLHLLEQTEGPSGNPVYSDDPQTVQRVIRRCMLTTAEKMDRSIGVFKLAEFEKSVDGVWRLDGSYVPPLLRVGDSPFLQQQLTRLDTQLAELEPRLVAQLQDTFLRLERIAVMRSTLATMYRTVSMLADLRHGSCCHPCELFQALRDLYFQLCCFHELLPEQSCIPFTHGDVGASFARLFQLLAPRLLLSAVHHSHLKFARMNGLFSVSGLPEEVKSAQEVYLLIQRPSIHDRVRIEDVKVSATSRLALVQRMVLRGVPFKLVERVHFQHAFGPEVDFYQLTLSEEWALAAREGSLSFYETPALEKAQAFLFWR